MPPTSVLTVCLATGERYPHIRHRSGAIRHAIARALLAAGITDFRAYVLEDLQGEREKVTETDLTTLAGMTVSPLNTLILIREDGGDG